VSEAASLAYKLVRRERTVTTQRGRKGRKGRSRRKGWLASIWSRGSGDDEAELEYDLVVLEGADAKATFPVDRPEIQIGRAAPGSKGSAGIQLTDRSVSSKHALLSRENGRITIQHLPSATNPTLVNGRRIKRKRIRDGDRIVLGLVVLELRARRIAPAASAPALDRVPQAQIATDPLNVMAEIVLREGIDELRGERFPLVRRRTSIGRDEDCDIVLEVSSISRNHAALVWEDDQLILIHESAVNPTHVNGMEIKDRQRVFHGDEIRISESVAFEVVLETGDAPTPKPHPVAPPVAAEDATRLTSRPELPDEEPTRISNAVEPQPGPDAEATVFDPVPDVSRRLSLSRVRLHGACA